jgi:hypothetical protein
LTIPPVCAERFTSGRSPRPRLAMR